MPPAKMEISSLWIGGGSLNWQVPLGANIESVLPLGDRLLVRGPEGESFLFDEAGEELGRGRVQGSRSLFARVSGKILEIFPEADSITCFEFLTGNLLWRLAVPNRLRLLAISDSGNRMILMDSEFMYYHELMHKSAATEERTSFLEF